jgi:hypothetical protein
VSNNKLRLQEDLTEASHPQQWAEVLVEEELEEVKYQDSKPWPEEVESD